jgi:hypothetical protein
MAGIFRVSADVELHGPLADGTADRVMQEWATRTAKALGDEGVERLRAFPMNKTGRAHGGFQANLHVIQSGPVARIPAPMITGVVWGPWLEGTSKRNSSTRFKGYHLFRKTRLQLQARAPEVGQQVLDKLLPEIGGTP